MRFLLSLSLSLSRSCHIHTKCCHIKIRNKINCKYRQIVGWGCQNSIFRTWTVFFMFLRINHFRPICLFADKNPEMNGKPVFFDSHCILSQVSSARKKTNGRVHFSSVVRHVPECNDVCGKDICNINLSLDFFDNIYFDISFCFANRCR